MAAEIATADFCGARSRLTQIARRTVDSFDPEHSTELASALATLELSSGADKKAKRLFQTSLIKPTANALAQAEWSSSRVHIAALKGKLGHADESYEALALDAAESDDLREAVRFAEAWQRDEPYSLFAASFGSYHSAKARDFAAGSGFAERGLRTHKGDPVLLNNLSFCAAKMNRVADAESALSQIDQSTLKPHLKSMCTATAGLIWFRRGKPEKGIELYLQAVRESSEPQTRALALVMLAAELARIDPAAAVSVRETAIRQGALEEVAGWLRHVDAEARIATSIPQALPKRLVLRIPEHLGS